MAPDDILALVYKAIDSSSVEPFYVMTPEAIERFANLVAEKEREACANICSSLMVRSDKPYTLIDAAQAILARGNQ